MSVCSLHVQFFFFEDYSFLWFYYSGCCVSVIVTFKHIKKYLYSVRVVFCSSMSFNEAPGALDVTSSQFSEGMNISVTAAELEELTVSKDHTAQMKAAFIYYIKKNMVSSLISTGRSNKWQSVCHTLFPVSEPE